jgi:hypothetical protein
MVRRVLTLPALLVLAGGGLLAACSDDPEVATLDVGECVSQETLEGSIGAEEIDTVDCDDPHFAELIGKFDIDGDDYPGDDVVQEEGEAGCESRFEDYVGVDTETSMYSVGPVTPSQETWENADDREVLCFGFDDGAGSIGGSMEGAAE